MRLGNLHSALGADADLDQRNANSAARP